MNFKTVLSRVLTVEPKTILEQYARNEMLNKFPDTTVYTDDFVDKIICDIDFESENYWKSHIRALVSAGYSDAKKYIGLYESCVFICRVLDSLK
jgi:hypothetical protein